MEQYNNTIKFSDMTTENLKKLENETIENHNMIKEKIILCVDEIEKQKNKINEYEIEMGLYELIFKNIKEELNKR